MPMQRRMKEPCENFSSSWVASVVLGGDEVVSVMGGDGGVGSSAILRDWKEMCFVGVMDGWWVISTR